MNAPMKQGTVLMCDYFACSARCGAPLSVPPTPAGGCLTQRLSRPLTHCCVVCADLEQCQAAGHHHRLLHQRRPAALRLHPARRRARTGRCCWRGWAEESGPGWVVLGGAASVYPCNALHRLLGPPARFHHLALFAQTIGIVPVPLLLAVPVGGGLRGIPAAKLPLAPRGCSQGEK